MANQLPTIPPLAGGASAPDTSIASIMEQLDNLKPLGQMAPGSHVPNSPRPEGEPGIDDRGGFESDARRANR